MKLDLSQRAFRFFLTFCLFHCYGSSQQNPQLPGSSTKLIDLTYELREQGPSP